MIGMVVVMVANTAQTDFAETYLAFGNGEAQCHPVNLDTKDSRLVFAFSVKILGAEALRCPPATRHTNLDNGGLSALHIYAFVTYKC